jgi:LysR family transcriptional regulator, transcriptional activator of the cysJI operon
MREYVPTLDQLRIFVRVARLMNVRKAAAELKMSQPSVSRHLKALEGQVGAKLFLKTTTGIQLTEPGRRCLSQAEGILRQVQLLRDEVSARNGQPKRLTVGATYSASALLMPAAITDFKRNHPQVEVQLSTANRRRIEEMVLASQLEIAVVTGSGVTSTELIAERFQQQTLVFFALKNHPIAKRGVLPLEKLEEFPLVIRENYDGRGTVEQLLKQLRGRGLRLDIALRCDSPDAVKAAVQKKLGLGVVYRDVILPEVKEGKFKIIQFRGINFVGRSFIIYNKASSLTQPAVDFLSLLRARRRETKAD